VGVGGVQSQGLHSKLLRGADLGPTGPWHAGAARRLGVGPSASISKNAADQ